MSLPSTSTTHCPQCHAAMTISQGDGMVTTCPQCGQEFNPSPSQTDTRPPEVSRRCKRCSTYAASDTITCPSCKSSFRPVLISVFVILALIGLPLVFFNDVFSLAEIYALPDKHKAVITVTPYGIVEDLKAMEEAQAQVPALPDEYRGAVAVFTLVSMVLAIWGFSIVMRLRVGRSQAWHEIHWLWVTTIVMDGICALWFTNVNKIAATWLKDFLLVHTIPVYPSTYPGQPVHFLLAGIVLVVLLWWYFSTDAVKEFCHISSGKSKPSGN